MHLFPNKETITFGKILVLIKFKVKFLDEATEFIDNLDDKVRVKILYNIK
jgi:hypothetical protein